MAQEPDQKAAQTPPGLTPKGQIPKTVAVALEAQEGTAPAKIMASGRGFLAEQILQVAFANDIKVREDADLVQILSAVDVDSDIPTEAYAAVVEILTYVYRANGQVPPEAPTTFGSAS